MPRQDALTFYSSHDRIIFHNTDNGPMPYGSMRLQQQFDLLRCLSSPTMIDNIKICTGMSRLVIILARWCSGGSEQWSGYPVTLSRAVNIWQDYVQATTAHWLLTERRCNIRKDPPAVEFSRSGPTIAMGWKARHYRSAYRRWVT